MRRIISFVVPNKLNLIPALSIPFPPYFYQFLLLLIFINSSSSLFLSIPLLPYFYQFFPLLIFINSSSSLFLSIPLLPYFYQFFLLLFIFINSSSSLFLSTQSGLERISSVIHRLIRYESILFSFFLSSFFLTRSQFSSKEHFPYGNEKNSCHNLVPRGTMNYEDASCLSFRILLTVCYELSRFLPPVFSKRDVSLFDSNWWMDIVRGRNIKERISMSDNLNGRNI